MKFLKLYCLMIMVSLFIFGKTQAQLSIQIPDTVIEIDTEMLLPVFVLEIENAGTDSLFGYSFTLKADFANINIKGFSKENSLSSNFIIFENHKTDSTYLVSGAGTYPIKENGVLVYLLIEALQVGTTPILFESIKLNEGSPAVNSINGDITITLGTGNEIIEERDLIKFQLSQNYPNPFNPTTNIQFSLPEASEVELKVFDLTGREVANLLSGFKTAGNYKVSFDASNLSSGVYIYRIKAGGFVETKRMLLIK